METLTTPPGGHSAPVLPSAGNWGAVIAGGVFGRFFDAGDQRVAAVAGLELSVGKWGDQRCARLGPSPCRKGRLMLPLVCKELE